MFFSKLQRLHFLDSFVYVDACFIWCHFMAKFWLRSLSVQICFERVVLCSYFLFLNDEVWLLYLSLNALPAWPIWIDSVLLLSTFALYIIDSCKQFAWRGHDWGPPLQLQVFGIWFDLFCSWSKIFLLCPDIMDSMFGKHEYDTLTDRLIDRLIKR